MAVRWAHRHPSLLPGCVWSSVGTGPVAAVRARTLCLQGKDPSPTPEVAGSTVSLGPSRQVSRHELPARQGRRPPCPGPLPTGSWLCRVLLRAQGAEAPAVFRNVSNHRDLRASKFSHGCKSSWDGFQVTGSCGVPASRRATLGDDTHRGGEVHSGPRERKERTQQREGRARQPLATGATLARADVSLAPAPLTHGPDRLGRDPQPRPPSFPSSGADSVDSGIFT